jgi:hypothetical protein
MVGLAGCGRPKRNDDWTNNAPEERLTTPEALRMYTCNRAYASFEENEFSSTYVRALSTRVPGLPLFDRH